VETFADPQKKLFPSMKQCLVKILTLAVVAFDFDDVPHGNSYVHTVMLISEIVSIV
jgi:hypothetical protein